MSDPSTTNPMIPLPVTASIHKEKEDLRSSTTASLPGDHVASCSAVAPAVSSLCSIPVPPTTLPSSTSKAPSSVSGSRFTAASPPTTVSGGPGRILVHGAGSRPGGTSTAAMPSLNSDLPSASSKLHVAEARAALVASMSNMLDNELQSRASLLHSNAAALSRQEQDVTRATEALRKENDKLTKVAKDAGRKIKELGNVQNWAEVLERDFLVLEETMRLVRGGGAESDEDEDTCSEWSGSGSYWSGSESERDHEAETERGNTRMGSPMRSLNNSVSKSQERKGNVEEASVIGKEKGKGSVPDNSSSAAGGKSTTSNPSPVDLPSGVPAHTNPVVLLDEAFLDSLAEALATDLRMGFISTQQHSSTGGTVPPE